MKFWDWITNSWTTTKKEESGFTPIKVSELPNFGEVEVLTNLKDSKKQLRHLDELVSIAEVEIISISKDLDKSLLEEDKVKEEIQAIQGKQTWQEQGLLLRLKRLKTHSNNLKQRVIIYSQNIELYLNLISRIQDKQAMKMGGLDETKIENVWLEYKEELEAYRNKLITGTSSVEGDTAITADTQEKLKKLKAEINNVVESRTPIDNLLSDNILKPDKVLEC